MLHLLIVHEPFISQICSEINVTLLSHVTKNPIMCIQFVDKKTEDKLTKSYYSGLC